jgi:hypothetical protein
MSAISDDTQGDLAMHKVQPKNLADRQFAPDQHAIAAATDIWGTMNSVNEKFGISQCSKVGLIGQNLQEFSICPDICPSTANHFNTNRSKLTGQLERIDGGLEWENRKS